MRVPSAEARTSSLPAMMASLATFYRRGRRIERLCYVLAAVLFASGLAHLGVYAVAGGPWTGPVSWRKPVSFGLSFGLTLLTITWVTSYIRLSGRGRDRLLRAFALASVAEVIVISVQAWRGVPSHFNVSTPLNATLAYTAAAGGAVLVATSVALTVRSFRAHPELPASMRLAIRVGFLTFLVALAIGAVMIAQGVIETRTVSQAAAYTTAVGLKPGHAATMHGILVLPALGWLLSFTTWTESRRTQVVALACLGYLLAAGVIVSEALAGIDPLVLHAAPLVGTALGAAGTICLLAAGAIGLAGLLRSPAIAGIEHPAASR